MGLFDTYGKNQIQIKAGDCLMQHYNVGSKTNLKDGIYVGFEGAVAIRLGKVVAESKWLTSKWGGAIDCEHILWNRIPLPAIEYERKIKRLERVIENYKRIVAAMAKRARRKKAKK
jgi:hypothetical protein